MNPLRCFFASLLFAPVVLVGEIWTTTEQEQFEGKFEGVYGPLVLITSPRGTRMMPVEQLNDESLLRLDAARRSQPAQRPLWSNPEGKVATQLKGKLQVWQDGKLVPFVPGTRVEPRFYLVYFGAHWCGPCRKFSPKLLAAYQELKRVHGDDIEVIFRSSDNDTAEQKKYVGEVGMPWPVLKYSALGSADTIERWAADGIPNLVVVTADGDLIYHSYQGREYLGPGSVLEKFHRLLELERHANSQFVRRAFHRLAVLQHIQSAAVGQISPKSYLVTATPDVFKGVQENTVELSLTIDKDGKVTSAETITPLRAVDRAAFVKATESWLFLPAVRDGVAHTAEVRVPVSQ